MKSSAWEGFGVIELAGVIRDLRSELEQAAAAGGDEPALRFELGPIELEVAVPMKNVSQP